MSSQLEIEQFYFSAARRGLQSLPLSVQERIKSFVESELKSDGYFTNGAGDIDLYISSFGIMLANLLGIEKASGATSEFLRSKGDGEGLDFIYVVSLCRAWRFFPHDSMGITSYEKIAEKLEYNRCADKLWNQASGTHFGSVYGTYLALGAYQNLGVEIPDEVAMEEAMKNLRSKDGVFGTDRGAESGTTPSTAFAIIILKYEEQPINLYLSWLLKQQHADGGFLAVSRMPFSDMHSTFYATLAIAYAAPEKLPEIAKGVEKFVKSSLVGGGFRGHLKETSPGIENTLYGLACLGLVADFIK